MSESAAFGTDARRRRVPERWRTDGRTFLYVVAAVLVALAAVAATRDTATMLTRIVIGVLIALALDPVASVMERRLRFPRGLAVAATALLVLSVAGLILAVLGPRVVTEVRQFSNQFPDTISQLERLPLVGNIIRDQDVAARADRWFADLPEQFTDARLAETATTLLSGLVSVLIVAVVAVVVLIDGDALVRRGRRILAPDRRDQADEIGEILHRTIGRYIGGSLTVALGMGLFVLAVGLVLGVPLVPLAAIWAMITDLIPQVGGALGGAFFVLLAVSQSVPTAIIAGGLFVVYMTIENHVITPAIVGKAVDLTPPTTMIAAFIGGAVAGIPGALLATPLTGAAKQLYLEAHGRRDPLPPDSA
ncbi:hypothetical protein BH24ACT5_BH24ACT5_09610 [soil metagenome]